MNNSQKIGGIAALVGAATNLLGLGVFLIVLAPQGYGSETLNPNQIVTFLTNNQAIMRLWYQIIYLAFGVCVMILSLALYERLKPGSPVLAQAVMVFGLVWAAFVIAIGMLSINNLSTVANIYGEEPAQAAVVWLALDSVETGLGAGGGETVVTALWFLLVSWAALQAGELARAQNYLGVVVGVAGLLSVVLALVDLMAISGLGLIVWLVWLGVVMLRREPARVSVPVRA